MLWTSFKTTNLLIENKERFEDFFYEEFIPSLETGPIHINHDGKRGENTYLDWDENDEEEIISRSEMVLRLRSGKYELPLSITSGTVSNSFKISGRGTMDDSDDFNIGKKDVLSICKHLSDHAIAAFEFTLHLGNDISGNDSNEESGVWYWIFENGKIVTSAHSKWFDDDEQSDELETPEVDEFFEHWQKTGKACPIKINGKLVEAI